MKSANLAEKLFSTLRAPMTQGLLKSSATQNALKSLGAPQVKSAETRELFNAGVRGNSKTAKSVDPTCYNSATVELTGLFDIVEIEHAARL